MPDTACYPEFTTEEELANINTILTKYLKVKPTHKKIAKGSHGTGDIYASSFTGSLMRGKDIYDAAVIAADFTLSCIEETQKDPEHWYGAVFETSLPKLIAALN